MMKIIRLILTGLMVSVSALNIAFSDEVNIEEAIFAGGCFWCMQPPFDQVNGVMETYVGYTGGSVENPTYQQVSSGSTGHTEAIQVVYDPEKVSYAELLDVFWRNIDPTDIKGQFVDRGNQYRPGIFYFTEEQKQTALQSRDALDQSGRFKNKVNTDIAPAGVFYKAEEYHQKYYLKSESRYKNYRRFSGREQFLMKHWGSSGH